MFEAKDFSHLVGMEGFSETLLRNHFTLYEGYVKNTNTLLGLLEMKEAATPEYSELQRRFGWEWNGMRLHELYFGNLAKAGSEPIEGELRTKIESVYGSVENWRKNFSGIGIMRGIGWVVLAYDRQSDRLFNIWVNEHDGGHLAGTTPLLVMDVFEHAFITDFGLKRADYVDAFFRHIDWETAEGRLA